MLSSQEIAEGEQRGEMRKLCYLKLVFSAYHHFDTLNFGSLNNSENCSKAICWRLHNKRSIDRGTNLLCLSNSPFLSGYVFEL